MADSSQIQGRSGVQQVPDGGWGNLRMDNYGDVLFSNVGGRYLEWCRRGYVFTGLTTSGTGVAVSGVGSGTVYPVLWNKTTTGKIVVPLILQITPVYYGAGATVANVPVGGFCFASVTYAGDSLNSAYIAGFTENTGGCMALGKGSPTAKWSVAATIGSAGVLTRILDIGGGFYIFNASAAMALGANNGAPPVMFNGFPILPPGSAIALCQTATAGATITYHLSFTWAELPNYVGF